jgi:hypothetical protein
MTCPGFTRSFSEFRYILFFLCLPVWVKCLVCPKTSVAMDESGKRVSEVGHWQRNKRQKHIQCWEGGRVEKSCNTYNIKIQQTTDVFRIDFLSPLLSSDSMWKYQIVAGHREYIRSAGCATRKWCCMLVSSKLWREDEGEKIDKFRSLVFQRRRN